MDAPLQSRRIAPSSWPMLVLFVAIHLVCFAAIWTGVTMEALVLCAALYVLRVFGITAGYHRYFSHRAFQTSREFQFVLAFLAQTSLQSGALWWAAKHRDHHRHSDTPLDAHSPRRYGFWFAHMGWIFNEQAQRADYSRITDFSKYPELVWLNRWHWVPGTLMGAAVFALFGWTGLVVGFFWSTVLVYHSTFCINSLAHVFGRQRYLTGDESRNNWLFALLSLGEGWHNNHHYYMASARQGFRWWEVDVTYYFLRVFAALGLIWEVKEPPRHILAGERAVTEDMKERLAALLASSFPVDKIAARVRARMDRLHDDGASALDGLRGRWAEAVSSGRDRWAHVTLPELPTMADLHARARRMFARSPVIDDIVSRARELLAQSVTQRLAAA